MVRKRTRGARKYESDENDSDSDADFNANPVSEEPAPKKYSLRERKGASFTADYDYYGLDDEDGEERRGSSDDEDYEVEPELPGVHFLDTITPDINPYPSTFNVAPTTVVPSVIVPPINTDNPDGLIDFEDMIRADIVVNRNKIDYDNLIQKSEIKLTVPKRRGRKPKSYKEEDLCPFKDPSPEPEENLFDTKPEENLFDTKPEENLFDIKPNNSEETNVETAELDGDAEKIIPPEDSLSDDEPLQKLLPIAQAAVEENGEKENGESLCEEKVKEASIDPLEMRRTSVEPKKDPPIQEPPPPPEPPQVVDDDDDDVIILEDEKQDVIVLDD